MTKPLPKQPRLFARIAVNFPVRISTLDTAGKKILTPAIILNVSRGGAAIQLNADTDPNSSLKIHWQDQRGLHEALAQPRWKQVCGNNVWRLGVENTENSQLWSNLIYFACRNRNC